MLIIPRISFLKVLLNKQLKIDQCLSSSLSWNAKIHYCVIVTCFVYPGSKAIMRSKRCLLISYSGRKHPEVQLYVLQLINIFCLYPTSNTTWSQLFMDIEQRKTKKSIHSHLWWLQWVWQTSTAVIFIVRDFSVQCNNTNILKLSIATKI